jgi:hypothetical protein
VRLPASLQPAGLRSARRAARPVLAVPLSTVLLSIGLLVAGCAAPAPGSPARMPPRAASQLAFCASAPAPRLAASLARAVPASLHAEVVPLGMTADGTLAYVSAWTGRFAGVAALNLATGGLRPIARFANPADDQADGTWGGRWLVWAQTTSLTSLDDFTVRAWDSVTGRTLLLGRSRAGPGGTPWPSPWRPPSVSGHFAAWAQGSGPGGLVQIRLADLRTGRVSVIASGHLQAPFFYRDLVVWPASTRPGTLTSLHAYSVATAMSEASSRPGGPAPLPVVLRGVRGTDFVVTDGTRTAYFDPGLTRLYFSPSADRAATVVLRLADGEEFSNLGMARDALAWTTTRATYLASTATGGYVRVTPAYGFAVTGTGPTVLISDAPATRSAHPALALHVLDAADIARPQC